MSKPSTRAGNALGSAMRSAAIGHPPRPPLP